MSNLRPPPASASGAGLRIALVASRFNEEIVERLLAGAVEALRDAGVETAGREAIRVAGAWELPVVVENLARRGDVDAVVALGAVIRGATPHFEYVAGQCCRGLMDVALRHGVPVGLGVLTCDDVEQARERSGGRAGNLGADAVRAAIEAALACARWRAG